MSLVPIPVNSHGHLTRVIRIIYFVLLRYLSLYKKLLSVYQLKYILNLGKPNHLFKPIKFWSKNWVRFRRFLWTYLYNHKRTFEHLTLYQVNFKVTVFFFYLNAVFLLPFGSPYRHVVRQPWSLFWWSSLHSSMICTVNRNNKV